MFKVIEGNIILMATFGGRLRRLREEKGLKQIELAKLLNLESSSTISQYENEELNRIPDAHILQKLADILNCSIDYLLARTDTRNHPPDPDIKDAPLAFMGNTEGLDVDKLEKIINQGVAGSKPAWPTRRNAVTARVPAPPPFCYSGGKRLLSLHYHS